MSSAPIVGVRRADGRVGIRNLVVVVYLVECARFVADSIAAGTDDVHVIGFGGCYPNAYAQRMLERLCTHPNIGAALLISLGCEGLDRDRLHDAIVESGRPAHLLVIQRSGGTRATVAAGREWVSAARAGLNGAAKEAIGMNDLVVGTICGGSDSTSGITANPAVGIAFDRLVADGATAIFEESGELIGCERHMASRAITSELGDEIEARIGKAAEHYRALGHGSFSPGNADGGLTTLEEKALGAYSKSGSGPIHGVVTPGQLPPGTGLYLLDIVPDDGTRWGYPNINDNAEIAELIACGSHIIVFTTGRGSVVGSAIAPVIKVCANPETYSRMADDMDINAGAILAGGATIASVADEILDAIRAVAAGRPSASEEIGHREFVLTYKSSAPAGPSCLPLAVR